jgi:hypothetical protein
MGKTNKHLEETNTRLEETNTRLEMYAETQTEFIQVVARHIEAQGEINISMRDAVREINISMSGAVFGINGAMRELAASQMRADSRLDRLAESVERFITEGRNEKS